MYSTRTRVHTSIPNGHPREEKSAYRTKVRGQVGELNGPRAPRQADCRARRGTPRRLPREDPREEVGFGVGVGIVECGLYASRQTDRQMDRQTYKQTYSSQYFASRYGRIKKNNFVLVIVTRTSLLHSVVKVVTCISLNSMEAVSSQHPRDMFARMWLTCHKEIRRVGRVGRGCYENASDLSATSRPCRARGICRTTRHTHKRAAALYTAADRRPTNRLNAWQAERESRPTRPTSL